MQRSTKERLGQEGDVSEKKQLYLRFAERYGYNPEETEAMRLCMLFGFGDDEIAKIMKITSDELEVLQICMLGKTRTNTVRELQALFIRYIMQKLPT